MHKRIILFRKTRLFKRFEGSKQLHRVGLCAEAGTALIVSEPEMLSYDHRDQWAVSFVYDGDTYYMLAEETGVQELVSTIP